MNPDPQKLVVVGHGAAGLAAAVSAVEQARSLGLRIEITLLEKAREAEAGGNTRWSPSYMRMAAIDRPAPGFEEDMRRASGGLADHDYFRTLAENAAAAIGWLGTYGVEVRSKGRDVTKLDADAVILASGGFQGDVTMMRKHFGPAAETLKLISPGTRFDTGDGIRMAMDQGASISGDWNGMHIEPIDPRSRHSAPVVLVYPYGIVVDQDGRRFFDEGGGLVHETWEGFARDIHFARPNGVAYAILDSRLLDIDGFERAIR